MRVGAADEAELERVDAKSLPRASGPPRGRAGHTRARSCPAPSERRRDWRHPISRSSANSSVGDSDGWVSPSPLIWVISYIGSHRARVSAHSRVRGSPRKVFSANILPFERLPLCGMASSEPPVLPPRPASTSRGLPGSRCRRSSSAAPRRPWPCRRGK